MNMLSKNCLRLFTAEQYINVNNVVDHVRATAAKYEFIPNADSVLDAVRDSASLLQISLSGEDTALAVERLLDTECGTATDAESSGQARQLPARQQRSLSARLDAAFKKQPKLLDLRALLLQIGGLELVAPLSVTDRNVPLLLIQGLIMKGEVTLLEMRKSDCQADVFKVLPNRRVGMICACTGYALSDDGLWYQHSWGLVEHGILETTERRKVYFGLTYPPDIFAPSLTATKTAF